MDLEELKRASILSFSFGVLFLVLGHLTSPGFHGYHPVTCTTLKPVAFRGIRFSDFTFVWFDGCSEHYLSLFSLIGILFMLWSLAFGGLTVFRKVRNTTSEHAAG